jgi:hypothetical protein
MKTNKTVLIVTILFTLSFGFCKAQFTQIMNPWGFALNNPFGSFSHHFYDVDSNKSIDHLAVFPSASGQDFIFNLNKSTANTTPNFANCIDENFMNYWQMTDSIHGLYQVGSTLLGSTTKFFDLDSDGDQDMISCVIADNTNNPDQFVSVYMMNENKPNASPYIGMGFASIYFYKETQPAFNMPAQVSNDTIAIHIFDIGHITKPTAKDIIALELGAINSAKFVLYQDTSIGNKPSFLPRQDNPFGLTTFTTANPYSMPLLIDADNDDDNDIIFLAGPNENNLSWYYFQNTGTVNSPNFSTPFVVNPFGLTNINAGSTQDNLIVLYKVDGNHDGKEDIIFGNDNKIFYFENNYVPATPTSLLDFQKNKITLYPNPATDVLYINNSNAQIASIKIMDNKGIMIAQQAFINSLSISNYASGMYHIICFDKSNKMINRASFIKK